MNKQQNNDTTVIKQRLQDDMDALYADTYASGVRFGKTRASRKVVPAEIV
jgi:hypothetical protein